MCLSQTKNILIVPIDLIKNMQTKHMEIYIFIKDNMEGKRMAESFHFHPQLVRVTWAEGAPGAA